MDDYQILRLRNPAPDDIPRFSQDGFFFNEWAHLRQQDPGPLFTLFALNLTTQQADARCAFFSQDGQAISPRAAPFGSLEFRETLPDAVLADLINALREEAQATGAFRLRLTHHPYSYAPAQTERLTTCLRTNGFRPIRQDLNFHLPIDADSFGTNLHLSERRRLLKCQRAGFRVGRWEQPCLETVLSFLQVSRQQQGYALTLSLTQLHRLLNQFPVQFPVFAVWDGATLAAVTVTVRVRSDILYNFLPADNLAYRSFSPAVMLTDGLVRYGRQTGIRLLDLGVSLDARRQPKPGLIRFKRNLGAVESVKLTFESNLI